MNLFAIAKELGMTVARLTQELTMDEFCEWLEFFQMEAERAERRKG